MGYIFTCAYWKQKVTDQELLEELSNMDEASIEDAFYRDLAF